MTQYTIFDKLVVGSSSLTQNEFDIVSKEEGHLQTLLGDEKQEEKEKEEEENI